MSLSDWIAGWQERQRQAAVRRFTQRYGLELSRLTAGHLRELRELATLHHHHGKAGKLVTAEELTVLPGPEVRLRLKARRERFNVLMDMHRERQEMIRDAVALSARYGLSIVAILF